MSEDTNAVDGATPAAPVDNAAPAANAQETATPASAEGQDENKEQERARDEKGRFQSRVNELTRNWRQTERELQQANALIQQLQSHKPEAASDKPPRFEDYTDLNQWAADVAQHAERKAQALAQQHWQTQQQQSHQQQVFGSYAAREQAYAAQNPSYSESYAALSSAIQFQQPVLEVLASSEHGPAIVDYLGQHLDVADKVARMPAHLAAAEVARIEARVSAPKQKPVTKAPDPTPTLGGGSAASKDPDRMSGEEWLAWRNSQLQRHGGR